MGRVPTRIPGSHPRPEPQTTSLSGSWDRNMIFLTIGMVMVFFMMLGIYLSYQSDLAKAYHIECYDSGQMIIDVDVTRWIGDANSGHGVDLKTGDKIYLSVESGICRSWQINE